MLNFHHIYKFESQSFMTYKNFTKLNIYNYVKSYIFYIKHVTVIHTIHIIQNKPTTYLESTRDKSLMKQALYLTGLPNGKLKQQLYICVCSSHRGLTDRKQRTRYGIQTSSISCLLCYIFMSCFINSPIVDVKMYQSIVNYNIGMVKSVYENRANKKVF